MMEDGQRRGIPSDKMADSEIQPKTEANETRRSDAWGKILENRTKSFSQDQRGKAQCSHP